MSKIQEHLQEEQSNWQNEQSSERSKSKAAQRHLLYNVVAYVLISIIEYWLAMVGHSQTLRADAFNNLSGIVSTCLLLIGLHISEYNDPDNDIAGQKFSDENIVGSGKRQQFVRWRYETIFSLITAVVMIAIAADVIFDGIKSLVQPGQHTIPEPVALIGAGIAAVIMLVVWYMNRRAGKKLQNSALLASAQDSLSDAFTSLGTLIAIGGALLLKLDWLDGATSIIVGCFILYSGIKIFLETSLNLADYFDPETEHKYRQAILQFDQVVAVADLNAHYTGNVVTVYAMVEVDAKMSVLQTYQLAEKIEKKLQQDFNVIDTYVAFVPDPQSFSDDEVEGTF